MRRRFQGRVWLLWAALQSTALACSGPDAVATMNRMKWAGWGLWILAIGLVLAASLRARRLGVPLRAVASGWILVLAHPGLWISVDAGDCGQARLKGSLLFTALAAAVGAWGVIRSAPGSQEDADRSPRP